MVGLELAGCSSSGGTGIAPACGPSTGTFCGTFSAIAVGDAVPHGIVYNPSGPLQGLWYDNATTDTTYGVTQFLLGKSGTSSYPTSHPPAQSRPPSILRLDFSIWFTETNAGQVVTIGGSRTIVEYSIPTPNSRPLDITQGPDGAMWFTESAVGKIGRIASNGSITEYTVGNTASEPAAVITGPDGALWFTEIGTGRIGHLTTQGSLTDFDAGPGQMSGDITVATDNALWFNKESSVTRMTTTGALTEFALPSGVVQTGAIFGSRNGGVFLGAIKGNGTGAIVSVTPGGATQEYDLPLKHLLPIEMAQASNGAFWMTVSPFAPGVSSSIIFELQ